jgi:hypothetical protein
MSPDLAERLEAAHNQVKGCDCYSDVLNDAVEEAVVALKEFKAALYRAFPEECRVDAMDIDPHADDNKCLANCSEFTNFPHLK